MTTAQAARLRAAMDRAFPLAKVSASGRLAPCLSNHLKDRHVLETALVAQAEAIVTRNLRHFRPADLAPVGQVAQDPDEFLRDLYADHLDALAAVLFSVVGRYRQPTLTRAELVTILSASIPHTMSLASGDLGERLG